MPDYTEPQHRFYPFDANTETRAETEPSDRRVQGIAIRYGDIAEAFGRETFRPGAFGDLDNADLILNLQHDRSKPLARTNPDGTGSLRLRNSTRRLTIDAEIVNTSAGDDALALYRQGILRGYSIEFMPTKWRQTTIDDETTTIIDKAELRGVALVDRPAYPDSILKPRHATRYTPNQGGSNMPDEHATDTNTQLVALFEALLEKREKQLAVTPEIRADLASEIAAAVEAKASEIAAAAVAQAQATAEEARAAADKAAEEQTQFDQKVEQRASLLTMVKGLLPNDFDPAGQTNHAILAAAAGNEISDAANRSEDYLRAKVETIVERRAHPATSGTPSTRRTPPPTIGGVVNVLALPKS